LDRLNENIFSNTFVTYLPDPIPPQCFLEQGLNAASGLNFECSYLFVATGWDAWRSARLTRRHGQDMADPLLFITQLAGWWEEHYMAGNPVVVKRQKRVSMLDGTVLPDAVDLEYQHMPPVVVVLTLPEVCLL